MLTEKQTVHRFELARVITILRDELGMQDVSGHLMSRDRLGIPLHQNLLNRLRGVKNDVTLVIDLEGVPEMTLSVADELGPLLFEDFLQHRQNRRNVYLAYCNLSNEIISGFSRVFRPEMPKPKERVRLATVVFEQFDGVEFSGARFIGEPIPDALRSVLEIVYSNGEVTSADLEQLGIPAPSRKLNELYRQYEWLLRQERRTIGNVWQNAYMPIVPMAVSPERRADV
jgi:hypothetical protein